MLLVVVLCSGDFGLVIVSVISFVCVCYVVLCMVGVMFVVDCELFDIGVCGRLELLSMKCMFCGVKLSVLVVIWVIMV